MSLRLQRLCMLCPSGARLLLASSFSRRQRPLEVPNEDQLIVCPAVPWPLFRADGGKSALEVA